MVLHVHGMDGARVRFPVGPHKTQISRLRGILCLCGGRSFIDAVASIASRGRENSFATANELFVTTKVLNFIC